MDACSVLHKCCVADDKSSLCCTENTHTKHQREGYHQKLIDMKSTCRSVNQQDNSISVRKNELSQQWIKTIGGLLLLLLSCYDCPLPCFIHGLGRWRMLDREDEYSTTSVMYQTWGGRKHREKLIQKRNSLCLESHFLWGILCPIKRKHSLVL